MLRSVLSVAVGLLLISAIVECLEFGLVALVYGGVTTDPGIYFSVRNRSEVLALKLVYNTAAAVMGGFVAARLARRAPLVHAAALAVTQTMAFGWVLANPDLRQTTPDWMWACLTVLTPAGIIVGGLLVRRR